MEYAEEDIFKRYMRIDKATFKKLYATLGPDMQRKDTCFRYSLKLVSALISPVCTSAPQRTMFKQAAGLHSACICAGYVQYLSRTASGSVLHSMGFAKTESSRLQYKQVGVRHI